MSTSACITTYSTRRSTTTAPGENSRLRPRVHHKWRPCQTPRGFRAPRSTVSICPLLLVPQVKHIGALQISSSLTFPSPPIMEEKPGPRPQLAGSRRRHSSALYQPIPSAHARQMAHSTVAPALSPRSRPPKPSSRPPHC